MRVSPFRLRKERGRRFLPGVFRPAYWTGRKHSPSEAFRRSSCRPGRGRPSPSGREGACPGRRSFRCRPLSFSTFARIVSFFTALTEDRAFLAGTGMSLSVVFRMSALVFCGLSGFVSLRRIQGCMTPFISTFRTSNSSGMERKRFFILPKPKAWQSIPSSRNVLLIVARGVFLVLFDNVPFQGPCG